MIISTPNNSGRLSIAAAARALGLRPRDLSDAFYAGVLPDDLAPINAGRRSVDPRSLSRIEALLRSAGKIKR